MTKPFEFADFVDEFAVSFDVIIHTKGTYAENGKWQPGEETKEPMTGMILPFTRDELQRADNGNYTTQDRKVYTKTELVIGAVVEYKGKQWTIGGQMPYDDYTDIFIYYAKGTGKL